MNILHITREHDSTTRKPLLSLIQSCWRKYNKARTECALLNFTYNNASKLLLQLFFSYSVNNIDNTHLQK